MKDLKLSRRTVLKQTFGFSATVLIGSLPAVAKPVRRDGVASHFTMIGDWGKQRGGTDGQSAVARGMAGYLTKNEITPEAMFFLGDNFYGKMPGGVKCPRWKKQFSAFYPPEIFPCPCYAILGNHEYDDEPKNKITAQLNYKKHKPATRWNMPAKWYRVDLGPEEAPLMTVLCLDSNFSNKNDQLTPAERQEQLTWLKAELAKPRTTPWLVVNGHHPLYSCGHYGDFPEMTEEWDGLFREHGVHFYFCGHEHDLQHLEFEGHPTSFVVSGGGGAPPRKVKDCEDRGPFAEQTLGFTHLEVTNEEFIVRHVNEEEQIVHAFSKTPDGEVNLLEVADREPEEEGEKAKRKKRKKEAGAKND